MDLEFMPINEVILLSDTNLKEKKKKYMCFGSSPSWNNGVGNIGIFSDFFWTSIEQPNPKIKKKCPSTVFGASYKIAKDAITKYVSNKQQHNLKRFLKLTASFRVLHSNAENTPSSADPGTSRDPTTKLTPIKSVVFCRTSMSSYLHCIRLTPSTFWTSSMKGWKAAAVW